MDSQLNPERHLLGNDLTVLDLLVTAVSRLGPSCARFYRAARTMAGAVRRVDAEPRLKKLRAVRSLYAAPMGLRTSTNKERE